MYGFLAIGFVAYYLGFKHYDNWFSNGCAGIFLILWVWSYVDDLLKKFK